MDRQDLIRQRLNKFLKESGVTAKHVSIVCGIPQDVLSRYRNDLIKKDLYEESLQAIEKYLNEHNN